MVSVIGSFSLKPEPMLTVTEWAERNVILTSKGSAEEGPYRVTRTPYLQEPQDCMSARSKVQNLVLMWASQLAKTTMGFNVMGYYIAQVPSPILYVMPTVEMMERTVKQRIDPMIESCPALKKAIGPKRQKDGGNTLKQKDYAGGTVIFSGANSAASLASMPIRVAIEDEVDRFPDDVDGEGSPISLVDRRQTTFSHKKKRVITGTPTIEGASRVETEFLLTEQSHLYVGCPVCGHRQTLEFENMKWTLGVPGKVSNKSIIVLDAWMECVAKKCKIEHKHKTFLISKRNSEWRMHAPENFKEDTRGYFLNGLYSPDGWLSWKAIVEEWLKCEGDEPKLKAFWNTILSRTYKVKGEAPPWQQLHERAVQTNMERNVVMADVAFITCGVDIQGDRIELEIVGWSVGRISQSIDYRVLMGDTGKPDVWVALGEVMNETWKIEPPRPAGNPPNNRRGNAGGSRTIGIRLMAIDIGFNNSLAYDFCKKWGTNRAVPVRGGDDNKIQFPFASPKGVNKTKQGKNVGKLKVYTLGGGYLKSQLYGWLRLGINPETGEIPKGYCHLLPNDTHYFRGLCGEELTPVKSARTNAIKYEWVKRYARNEPLDCRIYATGAAYILGFDRWSDVKWESMRTGAASMGSVQKPAVANAMAGEAGKQHPPDPLERGNAGAAAAEASTTVKKTRKSKGGFW